MKTLLLCGIIVLGLGACKTEKPIANLNYSENLSKYRPKHPDTTLIAPTPNKTSVTPIQSVGTLQSSQTAEIEDLLGKIAETNKKIKATVGYRVQIYAASDRIEAMAHIEKARKILPDERIELEYEVPSYKVKIGYYLTRLEAYKTYLIVREAFPEAVILNEKVLIELEKYYED